MTSSANFSPVNTDRLLSFLKNRVGRDSDALALRMIESFHHGRQSLAMTGNEVLEYRSFMLSRLFQIAGEPLPPAIAKDPTGDQKHQMTYADASALIGRAQQKLQPLNS